MPHVTVPSGAELYYKRVGAGPPLLLIMGTGLDHTAWQRQIRAYSPHFECILFDNRGAGKSTAPPGDLSVKAMAEDAAGLLDGLGIATAHISGLSLGSCIAQELTLARPDLVETLQLHGTWGRGDGYAARKFRAQIRLIEKMDLRDFYNINVLWFLTPEYMFFSPEKVERRIESILRAAPSRKVLAQQYRANLGHDSLDRLGAITAPTLVTVGSFDTAIPPMYGRAVAEAIPGARLVEFAGGGHLHNVEHPGEFNAITLKWMLGHAQD